MKYLITNIIGYSVTQNDCLTALWQWFIRCLIKLVPSFQIVHSSLNKWENLNDFNFFSAFIDNFSISK